MVGKKTDWDSVQSTHIVHAMHIPSCISVLHAEPFQLFSKGPATKIYKNHQTSWQLKEMDFLHRENPWDMHCLLFSFCPGKISRTPWSHDEFLRAQLRVPSQALLPLHGEVSWAATWQTQYSRLWPHLTVPKRAKKCTIWKHWSQLKIVEAFLGGRLQWTKAHQQ